MVEEGRAEPARSAPTRKPKPSGRLEVFTWFYMRLSGLLLITLVLVHFGVMHLHYGVFHINFDTIVARYRTPFWRLYDLLLLTLGLTHGLNGMRILVDDYIHPRGWRTTLLCILATLGLLFLVMGAYTILTFEAR